MTEPRWLDGKPANLEAAAHDALDWLRWWKRAIKDVPAITLHMNEPARRELWRMRETIDCLQALLPPLSEAVFDKTPEPPLYNAVAVIVASSDRALMEASDGS